MRGLAGPRRFAFFNSFMEATMQLDKLVSWQAHMLQAYEQAGHAVSARQKRDGSQAVSLGGHRATDMRVALAKIDKWMNTRVREN